VPKDIPDSYRDPTFSRVGLPMLKGAMDRRLLPESHG
jgi:hypothetical protein